MNVVLFTGSRTLDLLIPVEESQKSQAWMAECRKLGQRMVSESFERFSPERIIVGDCPTGFDELVRTECDKRGIDYMVGKAVWRARGPVAGPDRNAMMAHIASLHAQGGAHDVSVVAFPGGKGTENCVKQALAFGLTVRRVGLR